jgi:RNA polymerase subunit RPABC4/transcription elongation factor Spt4
MFEKKCPRCGQKVTRSYNYCPYCQAPLATGVRVCGKCGHENPGDAKFCGKCREPLDASEAPQIERHRWARREEEFAVRIEANDLPGMLKRGVKVEPGTNAMLIEKSVNQGIVPPGEYTISTIGQRIKGWLTAEIPDRITILLVDVTPTEMEFHLGGRFTSDPLPVGMTIRLNTEITEPGKFLINVVRGKERITKEDIRQYLYPEVTQVADRWLRDHKLQELVEDASQTARFELALEEALRTTFSQSGLSFLNVRTLELNLEPYEQIQHKYSQANLIDLEAVADLKLAEAQLREKQQQARTDAEAQASLTEIQREYDLRKAQADLEAKKRFNEIEQQNDLVELSSETAKVELAERKAQLYERMRQAVSSEKMGEVVSEAEFEKFLDDIDHEKLLREKERAELLKAWEEESQDKELARAHLLAKLQVEQEYELRTKELILRSDLSEQELDNELKLERKRSQNQFDIQAQKYEFDLKRRRAEDELRREQESADLESERIKRKFGLEMSAAENDEEIRQMRAEMELGLEGLRGMKQVRLENETGKWELEAKKKELEWQQEQDRIDREIQRERERLEFELERMEKLGQMSIEAIISVSSPEQAKVLADLKKSEFLSGMTEEQILAAAAKDSPEVAKAFQEKFRAIAEGKTSQEVTEMYERMLSDRENAMQLIKELSEQRAQDADKYSTRTADATKHAIDQITEVAKAQANRQSPQPVILTGSGMTNMPPASQDNSSSLSQEKREMVICPNCRRRVAADENFCPHCGESLLPVKK